jgi:hypothetical protein
MKGLEERANIGPPFETGYLQRLQRSRREDYEELEKQTFHFVHIIRHLLKGN